MAKSTKKPATKVAKAKVTAKAKKPAKVKAAPKKVQAKPAKKVVAKKEVVKPVAVKKEVVAKKSTAPKEENKPAVSTAKPQHNLINFPALTQRPIAHKQTKPAAQDDKTRYSDDELKEFENLIKGKLEKSREEFRILKETLNRNNDAGTDSTSGGNTKVLEDGAETAEKENLSQLAARQLKYITNLENALVRIKNRTYGICTVTGKLIPKERLIAVPHTTQSIEAKMMQHD
ncbi:MAG: TraR/DksA C4-type zinc finger protein [Bacteroidota bacterium]